LDRIFSVHSIYFWREPERVVAQLVAALRPQGMLVFAFRADGPDVPERFRDPVYHYSAQRVVAMLVGAGLSDVRSHSDGAITWLSARASGHV
jgi:SAM-dependent methyltransferase